MHNFVYPYQLSHNVNLSQKFNGIHKFPVWCGDWILLTVNKDIWQWRVICETLFTLFYLPVSTQIKLICPVQHAEHEHIYTYNVPATWDLFTLIVGSVIPRCFHCKQTRGSHVDHAWVTAAVNQDCEPGDHFTKKWASFQSELAFTLATCDWLLW